MLATATKVIDNNYPEGFMRFYLSFIFTLVFALSLSAQAELLENKISITTAGWPGFGMLFLLDTGINYDRVISERWGLFAGLKYELAGHMHGLYQGGTVEVGGKFLLWSHGERAFTKGVVAALGTGFGVGATTKHGDQNSQTMIEKRLWIPFTAAVHYMYTWDNNVFITAGLKSQIFQIQLPKAVVFYPYPRLELSVGYGF